MSYDAAYKFLESNPNVAYSTTTLSKKFDIKRSKLNGYFTLHNDVIMKVNPADVGSGKTSINVYKWKN